MKKNNYQLLWEDSHSLKVIKEIESLFKKNPKLFVKTLKKFIKK